MNTDIYTDPRDLDHAFRPGVPISRAYGHKVASTKKEVDPSPALGADRAANAA